MAEKLPLGNLGPYTSSITTTDTHTFTFLLNNEEALLKVPKAVCSTGCGSYYCLLWSEHPIWLY